MTKQAFYFSNIGLWVLPANAFARNFAGHLMQVQCDREPLLSCHTAIALDLFRQCRGSVHVFSIR